MCVVFVGFLLAAHVEEIVEARHLIPSVNSSFEAYVGSVAAFASASVLFEAMSRTAL